VQRAYFSSRTYASAGSKKSNYLLNRTLTRYAGRRPVGSSVRSVCWLQGLRDGSANIRQGNICASRAIRGVGSKHAISVKSEVDHRAPTRVHVLRRYTFAAVPRAQNTIRSLTQDVASSLECTGNRPSRKRTVATGSFGSVSAFVTRERRLPCATGAVRPRAEVRARRRTTQ